MSPTLFLAFNKVVSFSSNNKNIQWYALGSKNMLKLL